MDYGTTRLASPPFRTRSPRKRELAPTRSKTIRPAKAVSYQSTHVCIYTPRALLPRPHTAEMGEPRTALSLGGCRAGAPEEFSAAVAVVPTYMFHPHHTHSARKNEGAGPEPASIHPSIHMQLPLPRDSSKKKKGGMMWGGDASGKPAPRRKLCGRLWGAGCSHTLRSLIAAGEISPR